MIVRLKTQRTKLIEEVDNTLEEASKIAQKNAEELQSLGVARKLFVEADYESAIKELEKIDTYHLDEKFRLWKEITS